MLWGSGAANSWAVQANEGVISNLQTNIDSFKRKVNNTVEENQR
jgi:chromosome segregation ATPase